MIAVGWYCRASDSAGWPRVGDDALEALVAREAEQDARVVRVVLDDQQHGVAVLRSSSRSSATISSRGDRQRPAAPARRDRRGGDVGGARVAAAGPV